MADHFEQIGPDNLLVATGNVEVTRGAGRLLADRVEINRESGDAVAVGRAIFYDGDDRLTGQRIEYNIKTGTGVIYQAEVHAAPYYRLTGERLERVGDSVYQVRHGVFTTCEDEPPSWSFHLGDGTADLEDFVYGWHVSFWVKSIPVIPYFPFFAGAIRKERQSGFLPPQFGTSTKKGFFAEIPFFWAISDSQDATGTFDAYEKRGFGGQLEYRYVISQDQRGKLYGFFVDEVFKDGELRGFGSIKHDWQIAPGLSLRGDLNAVSDDLVLRDYETSLQTRSAQRAESNLFLTKTWTNWNFVSRLYWYQDLTTVRPIELQRVPELTLSGVRAEPAGAAGRSLSGGHEFRGVLPLGRLRRGPFRSPSSGLAANPDRGLRDRHALRRWARHRLQHDGHRRSRPGGRRPRDRGHQRRAARPRAARVRSRRREPRLARLRGRWLEWSRPAPAHDRARTCTTSASSGTTSTACRSGPIRRTGFPRRTGSSIL